MIDYTIVCSISVTARAWKKKYNIIIEISFILEKQNESRIYIIATMEKGKGSKCEKLMVAAIDFGTTYSGYAFSMKHDWGKVWTNSWSGGSLLSHKAPTCLLLKKDKSESWFGYEAEDKYSQLTSEGHHHDYYFFERFKMILHEDVVCI